MDFAATIADLAGITPPKLVNGTSVAPVLANTATSWRSDFPNAHWNGKIPANGLVKGDVSGTTWKFIEYVTGERELYDLDVDPFGLTNRWNDPACDTQAKCAAAKTALPPRLHPLQSE